MLFKKLGKGFVMLSKVKHLCITGILPCLPNRQGCTQNDNRTFLFIISFSFFLFSFTGNLGTTYNLVSKIPFEGGSFTTDNLQNVYVFHGSSLRKYNSQGKLMFNYSDKSYGAITSVDVNDPMKVLVFYKDFPEVVLLDNTLSVNGNPFSPADVGYPLATLACTSHDNGVWLYDAQNFQLIRLDVNLNAVVKTGNFAQTLGISLNPDYLFEYDNYVYMNDSAQGILVFDSYGTYFKTIPITGLTTFQVRGDDLFYITKNRVRTFHLKTIMEDETKAPDTLATEVRIEKNLLFEKFRDTVRVFDIR
jgi:hypothetical protein